MANSSTFLPGNVLLKFVVAVSSPTSDLCDLPVRHNSTRVLAKIGLSDQKVQCTAVGGSLLFYALTPNQQEVQCYLHSVGKQLGEHFMFGA